LKLKDILKKRHDNGAYGNSFLSMDKTTYDSYIKIHSTVPRLGFLTHPLAILFGIPVVVDDTIREGYWQLRDTHTKRVLHEGAFIDEDNVTQVTLDNN
jgi:hypothetical protein